MKLHHYLIIPIILAVAAIVRAFQDLRLCANTYDAAVETHPSSITRTNDAAVAARHLLWKKGSADGGIALSGASDVPLGTVDNIEAGTGVRQSVLLLGKGDTKKMVSAGAIGAGVRVFGAANGKIQTLPAGAGTYNCVGVSLTAAGDADQILEVADCSPYPVVVSGT